MLNRGPPTLFFGSDSKQPLQMAGLRNICERLWLLIPSRCEHRPDNRVRKARRRSRKRSESISSGRICNFAKSSPVVGASPKTSLETPKDSGDGWRKTPKSIRPSEINARHPNKNSRVSKKTDSSQQENKTLHSRRVQVEKGANRKAAGGISRRIPGLFSDGTWENTAEMEKKSG